MPGGNVNTADFPNNYGNDADSSEDIFVAHDEQWNAKLTSALIENGFSQSKSDYSLYTKSDKDVFLALLVYVNDIIITGNNVSKIDKFKVFLKETSNNYPILDNITDHQKLMGKLIYLTNTRPDISYDVYCLSQFMHSLLKFHLKIAFKILGYLKSYLVFLPVTLHYDSNSTIKIVANPVFHERTKHLEIDLHFVREKILKGVVKTIKVESTNQIADILTKGVDTVQHKELVKKLGMIDIYQVLVEFEYCRKLKD
ncbi:ribonuclease H-like domain-containing protein [Tanacetum coccineum]